MWTVRKLFLQSEENDHTKTIIFQQDDTVQHFSRHIVVDGLARVVQFCGHLVALI
jgi:hypothetical protein